MLRDHDTAGHPTGRKACALLWEGSFLWGVMAWQALQEAGLTCTLVTGEQVRCGVLSGYRMLYVPGGWAANKQEALGEAGCLAIRRFVEAGGHYLGICGGAGLATGSGLRLLPVDRRPRDERLASFSGGIRVATVAHPLWQGVARPIFSAWWPSQLAINGPAVRVLASYGKAEPDALSADIPVALGEEQGWPDLEARYGILLDPGRIRGEPAVLEGHCGRGRVLLSLLHFDTPGDASGRTVLQNLWRILAGADSSCPAAALQDREAARSSDLPSGLLASLAEVQAEIAGLIAFGETLSLWRWRNAFLLQWRRGVRGLEYSTLAVMIREIGFRLLVGPQGADHTVVMREALQRWEGGLREVQGLLGPFCDRAKGLLAREARCLETRTLSPLYSDDGELRDERQGLFGDAMRHGGAVLPLLKALDRLWIDLVRSGMDRVNAAVPPRRGIR